MNITFAPASNIFFGFLAFPIFLVAGFIFAISFKTSADVFDKVVDKTENMVLAIIATSITFLMMAIIIPSAIIVSYGMFLANIF